MLRVIHSAARAAPRVRSPAPALVLSRSAGRLTRRRSPPPAHPPQRPPPAPAQPPATLSPAASIPVHVPDDPHGVIDLAREPWADKLRELLSVPALVVQRQLEMMNVFLGWEEANKYALMAPDGRTLGYLLEEETGFTGTMSRQLLKTHRPFRATVISPEGEVLLRVHRPFALINSRIFVSTPTGAASAGEAKEEMKRIEAAAPPSSNSSTALTTTQKEEAIQAAAADAGEVIGEVQQEWHLYKRRYNLFVKRAGDGRDDFEQFARYDGSLLAWDFEAKDEEGRTIGSVNRNFSGFARELFTDTGAYVCSFEAASVDLTALPEPSPSPLLSSPSSVPSTSSVSTSSTFTSSASQSSTPPSETLPPALIPTPSSSLPLSHRATLLASAITIDIDYFSRSRGGLFGGGMGFMPIPIPMGGSAPPPAEAPVGAAGGAADETAPVIGAGNPYDDRPLPSTGESGWSEDSEGGLRTREEGVPRGEDGVVPGGGSGQGWGGYGQDEVMQDPWASESGQEEGGTWSWGDLWGDDDGGGGGGGDGDW
ncbi:hypothetical protein JCM6882_001041 [Rhodosporidiobolus microsporus]